MSVLIKPGIIVSLATKVRGGVKYHHKDLDVEKASNDLTVAAVPAPEQEAPASSTQDVLNALWSSFHPGQELHPAPMVSAQASLRAWETLRVIDDPDEFDRATKIRNRCRTLIASNCITAIPGVMLCPTEKVAALDAAIVDAKALIDEFHLTARYSRVEVWVYRGEIAESDTEATRGIAAEIKSLLADMQSGIVARDAEAIREACRKAKALGGMLEEEHAAKVARSIDIARKAAREIVKVIDERGDAAIQLLADMKLAELRAVEESFLDFEAPQSVDPMPAAASVVDLPDLASPVEKVGPEERFDEGEFTFFASFPKDTMYLE